MSEGDLHPRVAQVHADAMLLRLVAHEADIELAAVVARPRRKQERLRRDGARAEAIAARLNGLAPPKP